MSFTLICKDNSNSAAIFFFFWSDDYPLLRYLYSNVSSPQGFIKNEKPMQ